MIKVIHYSIIGVFCMLLGDPAHGLAADGPEPAGVVLPADLYGGPYGGRGETFQLAQAETGDGGERMHMSSKAEAEPWKEPSWTGNKAHKYLGLASLGAATLAALSAGTASSDNEKSGIHHSAAVTAAALGGAAVGTGLVFHWEDFHLKDGPGDPDNLHALLGLLGTVGYALAVGSAPDTEHQDAGMVGLLSMAASVKVTW
ncbi:MAG: hypothetical protein ACE5FN_09460 [Leptospirillia bacterium]